MTQNHKTNWKNRFPEPFDGDSMALESHQIELLSVRYYILFPLIDNQLKDMYCIGESAVRTELISLLWGDRLCHEDFVVEPVLFLLAAAGSYSIYLHFDANKCAYRKSFRSPAKTKKNEIEMQL